MISPTGYITQEIEKHLPLLTPETICLCSLEKMKSSFAFFIIICITGLVVPVLGLSVLQTPEEINTTEGENVSIMCYIEANSSSERIVVVWLQNNLTVSSKTFNTSTHRSLNNGNVRINATLHLPSIQPNDTGIYYCKVTRDIPTLQTAYGKGTHLYIVNSSTVVTTTSPVKPSKYTVMIWSLSGLVFACIAIFIHIYYKGHYRKDHKEEINDATIESQNSVTSENVVYAAVNVSENREGMKSRNENCAALVPETVTCTEESVTYSVVHIRSKRNDEG